MRRAKIWASVALAALASPSLAEPSGGEKPSGSALAAASADAQRQLQQTFTNLKFEDFGPSPVKGPIYQAMAGGRLLYFAPESEHLLFAAIYDRNGLNVTAMGEQAATREKLARIDESQALVVGPAGAPSVIEFTDPECPYCRALERFWAAKASEGKQVRRLIFFVTGIHEGAAAKAEHILCSPDKESAFRSIYSGAAPARLETCEAGRRQVEAQGRIVSEVGIQGTPTLIADGHVISGFRQGEIETFLGAQATKALAKVSANPPP